MSIPPHSSPIDLHKAYAEIDREQRIRLSRIGCTLGLVMVPLFWGLDWVVYPDVAMELGLARLLCVLGVGVIWALLGTAFGRRWLRFTGIAWALIPGVAISWMIYLTEGERSPYYAGLNLVMIVVSLLMPWRATEVAALCLVTIAMYGVACIAHTMHAPLSWSHMITNLYFMGTTAMICVTAAVFSGRRRWKEFCLRHELDRRNQELLEMDRLKSEFYANISHELRTPLTLILAPLQQVLARPDLDRPMVQQLGLMHGNALRLLRLINDILEIVRMDTGNLELRRTSLDFSQWVPGTAQAARHLAEAKGIVFTITGPPGPIPVSADPLRLEKVLLNLLSNAIKFTPSGGTIVVSWGLQGDIAWITVSDTGIGISPSDLLHLFRRFHQVDSSATRQYRGLGLGLSLSRDLVERHGGRLTVDSRLRVGSVFRVELPAITTQVTPPSVPGLIDTESLCAPPDLIVRAYREADQQELVTAAAADGPPLATVLEPEHPTALSDLVLVADDEPDMRRYLANLLLTRYRVILAADGEKAVALAKQYQPSLIMLDLMMPHFDGMEVCRQLRVHEGCCDTRIVLLTARADDETKLEALQGGADDFMIKPFSSEEVLTRAHNLLENVALQRHLRERNQALEQAMARLRLAEAQLIQAEKMNALGSLAAGLLHEINNPLNYAQVAVHLAHEQTGADNERLKEMLSDAAEGMQRIGSVISSLRTFAHPETDSSERPFPVGEAIDLALRFTSHQCAGITIERRGDTTLSACGSVNQISMVLVNLLANAARAIRATGDGRDGVIVVAVELLEGHVRLNVTDNGIGMDAERARRIFDPFYTTSEPGQGMGLGLAICHTIVRNHQGRIGVDSKLRVGTTVWLELITPTATPAREESHEQYA